MNDLERRVLEQIGEDTTNPDVFIEGSDSMDFIRESINDAIEEVSMLTGSTVVTHYLTLQSGRQFYRFNLAKDRVAWVKGAWLMSQNRRLEQTDLTRLASHDSCWLERTGTAFSYMQTGLWTIGFWPRPAAQDVVRLELVVCPARYTEAVERIRVREGFQWACVNYAVSEYWASRGDAKTGQWHHNKYLEQMGISVEYPQAAERVYFQRSHKEPYSKATD